MHNLRFELDEAVIGALPEYDQRVARFIWERTDPNTLLITDISGLTERDTGRTEADLETDADFEAFYEAEFEAHQRLEHAGLYLYIDGGGPDDCRAIWLMKAVRPAAEVLA